MSRAPSNFRQQDVSRAIRAAKVAGLHVLRVEVDPRTSKIIVIADESKAEETKATGWDDAPMPTVGKRRRK